MPTTVSHTIGTGGDYSTIAAWNSAAPANLVTANEIWQGLLLNQSFTGQTITISGSTTDATRYKQLTCNSGAGFRDNANVRTNALRYNTSNGAAISGGNNYNQCFNITESNFQMFGLQIANSSNNQVCINITGANVLIDSCIVEGTSGVNGTVIVLDSSTMKNTLVIKRGSGSAPIVKAQAAGTFYNCTLAVPSDTGSGGAVGVSVTYPSGTTTLENTAIVGITTALSTTGTKTITTCATDQSSPPSGFSNVTYNTSLFTATTDSARDFRLPSGSALIDAGTNDSTNAPVDITGLSRPQGSATDIGVWEFQVIPTVPGAGSVSYAGNAPTVTLPLNTVLTPFVA